MREYLETILSILWHKEITIKKSSTSILIVFSAGLLLVIHHLFLYAGHFGFDDIEYARLAIDLLNGNFDWQNHYSYRIVPILCTAISFVIFGINDFASALPALILSFSMIFGFWMVFKKDPWYLFISLAMYFTFQWNIYYSDKLMPDIYVSCFVFWAFLLHLKNQKKRTKAFAYSFATMLFLAFNAKGTVILVIPVLSLLMIQDIFRSNYTFWKNAIPFGVGLGVLYGLFFWIIKGSPLIRFQAIDANSYFNECSYSEMPFSAMIDRWTNGFCYFLWDQSLIIPFLFACVGLVFMRKSNNKTNTLLYFSIILVCLLSVNFMTISISSYNPVCLDPRHIMMVTPIMAVCSTLILKNTFHEKSPSFFFAIVLLGLSILSYYEPTNARLKMNYPALREDIKEVSKMNINLLASPAYGRIESYYLKFEPKSNVATIDYMKMDSLTLDANESYFLVRNFYTEYHANIQSKSIYNALKKQGKNIMQKPFYISKNKTIQLYRLISESQK